MLQWIMHMLLSAVLLSAVLLWREAFLLGGGFNERVSDYKDDNLFMPLFRRALHTVDLNVSTAERRLGEELGGFAAPWYAASAFEPRSSSKTSPPAGLTTSRKVNGAELAGWENRVGTIEPNKLADIIAVDGNPLGDINRARSRAVRHEGWHNDPQRSADVVR